MSYDGGRTAHAEVAVPALAARRLRATFYLDGASALERLAFWRGLGLQGHELGNGALLPAALEDGTLPQWTPEMISDEIEETSAFLDEYLVSPVGRSFAYPWGKSQCAGGADYRDVVSAQVNLARSGLDGFNHPMSLDERLLRCVMADGYDAEFFEQAVQRTLALQSWMIVAVEGLGEGERKITPEAHAALLNAVASHPLVWVAPVAEVGHYVVTRRSPRYRIV